MLRCKPIVAGAFAAFSVLLAVGMAPPAGATTTAAGPVLPAITEQFRPLLPCNPDTTVGQEGCGERRVVAADKQLMSDAKLIFQRLHSTSARRDFVAAQTTWLAYRKADCQSQSDAYQGGTAQPVAYVSCLASADLARRLDLKGFYAVLTQGQGPNVPTFP
jgi:uncharacterized protein YecT (DUF1311 family)